MAEIKITDKRMFTPDGRLREESADGIGPGAATEAAGAGELEAALPPPPPPATEPLQPPGGLSFYDLLGVLAEPIALYLGELKLPDGETAENLDMARLHIDLLDVLRRCTAGNLATPESAALEDLLYRSRLRYVQKRG